MQLGWVGVKLLAIQLTQLYHSEPSIRLNSFILLPLKTEHLAFKQVRQEIYFFTVWLHSVREV